MNRPDNVTIASVTSLHFTTRHYLLIGALLLLTGVFLAPAAPLTTDGGIYYDMARAMAERGALHIAENGGVSDAPPVTKFLTVAHEGKVYPQYPSGYTLIAAPFYKLFGMRGLMLMNGLGFAVSIWLTFAIARRLHDEQVATWAAIIFAFATFAPAYAFAVWPHLLSLALWLGAVYAALLAHEASERSKALSLYTLSGLLIGAGVNIRVDAFLAVLALFFWMRIFVQPKNRVAPLMLALGLAPGLLLAAWLNQMKFSDFTPFSYGSSGGNDSVGRYLPVIALAAAAVAAAWALNLSALMRRASAALNRYWIAGGLAGLAAVLALTLLGDLFWRIIKGVYVLVFNLQAHDAYTQMGVERNEYGHLLFWGYPKKALIQSLPWAPLIVLPLAAFFRGKNVVATSLCLFIIAAPISFYALNQWYGGGSYSMRYFLPAAPFIAILSAQGLRELTTRAGPSRQSVLVAIVAAGALYLGLQEIGQSSDRFLTPAALYPQWLIAAAVFAAVSFTLTRPFSEQPRVVASSVALFALAYGVAVNLYEEIGHERTRAEQLALARDASAPIRAGALVITSAPLNFIPAEQSGASVMATQERELAEIARAAHAFAKAGRCVYFHNSYARDFIAPALATKIDPEPLWAPSERFRGDPRLAFFALQEQKGHCSFG